MLFLKRSKEFAVRSSSSTKGTSFTLFIAIYIKKFMHLEKKSKGIGHPEITIELKCQVAS